MQDIATVEHQAVILPAKPRKERQPSRRMQQALSHLATKGVNQREAAKLAGISEFHLSRELKKPAIQAFIARKAAESIQIGVLKAGPRLAELVHAESEHVAAKVSERLLEHGGILRPQAGHSVNVSINNSISAGYVVDLTPREASVGPMHNGTGQAASLHDPSNINDLEPEPRS